MPSTRWSSISNIVRHRWDRCCSSTSTVRPTRVGATDTAFPHRREGYNFLVVSQTMDPAISDRCTAWVRQTYAAMEPFIAPGRYVNYLDDDETGDAVPAAYGPNYRRLREIKTKVRPGQLLPPEPEHSSVGVNKGVLQPQPGADGWLRRWGTRAPCTSSRHAGRYSLTAGAPRVPPPHR